MLHLETIAELRAACLATRADGRTVGLVPTMGFLHDGHRSLMRAARAETDFVVVTIFVNPLQFGVSEDLDEYPRDLGADVDKCGREGVDVVFTPSAREMYPAGAPATTVHVEGLTASMCGAARPTHFDGVTTVVSKLFAITGPCRAYFGRKDAQQLVVITRMTADLNLPVEVVGCSLIREPDGLAMSSRNAYLAPDQRRAALVLSRALLVAADVVVHGERDPNAVIAHIETELVAEPAVALEYADVRNLHDLRPAAYPLDGDVLVALAARVGPTRLIDNVILSVHGTEATADLGTRSEGATPCNA